MTILLCRGVPIRSPRFPLGRPPCPAVVVLWLAATVAAWLVVPGHFGNVGDRPIGWLMIAVFAGGLAISVEERRRGHLLRAFLGSCAFLFGLLGATAVALYRTLLRSVPDATRSLGVGNAAASSDSLVRALFWWPAGLLLAVGYVAVLFRLRRGPVSANVQGEGY